MEILYMYSIAALFINCSLSCHIYIYIYKYTTSQQTSGYGHITRIYYVLINRKTEMF